ncbi:MAG: hypothetical protein RR795_07010 [Cetobacterium sp.]|uniref:hypothetical protein n=1 Tax=Cetobacterium sp. TaxID=2071632 RepID=UPI002FCB2AF1
MTGYLKLKYSKLEFIIAKLSVKYDGFTDYLFNKAHDYFSLGYSEFKIYLFLYCLFDGRPQDYSEELDSFRGIVRHDFDKYLSGKPLILVHTHSKTVEEIRIFLSFLKVSIFLSKNPILHFFINFFKNRK